MWTIASLLLAVQKKKGLCNEKIVDHSAKIASNFFCNVRSQFLLCTDLSSQMYVGISTLEKTYYEVIFYLVILQIISCKLTQIYPVMTLR